MATETKPEEKVKTPENPETKPVSAMDVIARLLEQNSELHKEVIELRTNGSGETKKGKAPKHAVRCLDTKTGNVYHSHASAGIAVASEYGLKTHNFVWYEVITKDKTRFEDITEEKYQVVLKANAEKQTTTQPAGTNQPARPVQTQGKGK